jgi:hypothetical protein
VNVRGFGNIVRSRKPSRFHELCPAGFKPFKAAESISEFLPIETVRSAIGLVPAVGGGERMPDAQSFSTSQAVADCVNDLHKTRFALPYLSQYD